MEQRSAYYYIVCATGICEQPVRAHANRGRKPFPVSTRFEIQITKIFLSYVLLLYTHVYIARLARVYLYPETTVCARTTCNVYGGVRPDGGGFTGDRRRICTYT